MIVTTKDKLEVLRRMQQVFTHRSNWTQHAFARDARGNPISPVDEKAVCWCLRGLQTKVTREMGLFDHVLDDVMVKVAGRGMLALMNDSATHEELQSFLKKVRERLESDLQ